MASITAPSAPSIEELFKKIGEATDVDESVGGEENLEALLEVLSTADLMKTILAAEGVRTRVADAAPTRMGYIQRSATMTLFVRLDMDAAVEAFSDYIPMTEPEGEAG